MVEFKSSKISKLSMKDCFDENIVESEAENVREDDSKTCIAGIDDEKKDAEQSDWQNDENRKGVVTPKRSSLGKHKNKNDSQQKTGALTKFFKKTDREKNISKDDSDTRKSEARENTSAQEEQDEVCLHENLELQSPGKSQVSQANKKLESPEARDENTKRSSFQQSDYHVPILSSDDESELEKSKLSTNEENTQPAEHVTPKTDKNAKKKMLTPKQLEKKLEIIKRKEEKLKLKLVY